MQIAWLEDFIELAKTGSFSQAAQNRYVTHPAFGRRIKAVEEWVGTPLVIRSQPVKLTPAGMVFLETALEVIDTLNTVRAQLVDSQQSKDMSLRVATGRALASLFFPQWYKEMVDKVGFFHANVSTSGTEGSIYKLISKESDLLIAYKTPLTDLLIDDRIFYSIKVGEEKIVPISGVDTHGNTLFNFPSTQNKVIPWLTYSQSLSLRGILTKHLQNLGYLGLLSNAFEADTYDTLLEMVKKGVGVAWLPYSVIQKALHSRQVTIIGKANLQIQTDILLFKHRDMQHPLLEKIWQQKPIAV